ncbi:LS1-like protein [Citrus sinensis]|uniref:LS1-like protein n=1 Tax=Citrus sinensis TaxID=2711 RepID=A0ACB8JW27_CITSI|nr:LS1-like protein [Citrus sinensis]
MRPYGRFTERRPTFENVSPSMLQIVLSACFNYKLQDDDVIIDAKSSQVGLRPLLLNKRRRRRKKMPCLYISTNVSLDGVDVDPIFADATRAVAQIIGRPEHLVMVILKGSVAISFNGNKEPAAYAEIVSMGGINREVKRKLIATIGFILQARLCIRKERFFLKVYDTTAGQAKAASKL